MNFEQAAIVGLLICMFIVYALEKFRVEVVAISGLAIAFLLGWCLSRTCSRAFRARQ